MFQTVDLRLLHLARRIGDEDAHDPTAHRRRELAVRHKREQRQRRALRMAGLRSWLAGHGRPGPAGLAAQGVPAARA